MKGLLYQGAVESFIDGIFCVWIRDCFAAGGFDDSMAQYDRPERVSSKGVSFSFVQLPDLIVARVRMVAFPRSA